jgi:hypothetical protein
MARCIRLSTTSIVSTARLNSDVLLKAATRQKYFVEDGNRFGWFNRKRGAHRVMSSNGRSPGLLRNSIVFRTTTLRDRSQ